MERRTAEREGTRARMSLFPPAKENAMRNRRGVIPGWKVGNPAGLGNGGVGDGGRSGASMHCPRRADFQVCCIADFQTRWPTGHRKRLAWTHASGGASPLPIWKSAIQQVWKPALWGPCLAAPGALGKPILQVRGGGAPSGSGGVGGLVTPGGQEPGAGRDGRDWRAGTGWTRVGCPAGELGI